MPWASGEVLREMRSEKEPQKGLRLMKSQNPQSLSRFGIFIPLTHVPFILDPPLAGMMPLCTVTEPRAPRQWGGLNLAACLPLCSQPEPGWSPGDVHLFLMLRPKRNSFQWWVGLFLAISRGFWDLSSLTRIEFVSSAVKVQSSNP